MCFDMSFESLNDCLCEIIWSDQSSAVISCWCWLCHRSWHLNADEHDLVVHRDDSYCCKHVFYLWITNMSLIYIKLMWSCLSNLRRIKRTCLTLSLIIIWLKSSAALLLIIRLRIRRMLTCKKLSLSLRWCIEIHHSNFWNLLSYSQFLKLTSANTLWVYLFYFT